MICTGNYKGTLEDSFDGSKESIDAYCVVVCEDVKEWGALREAILFRIEYLRQNTIPGSPFFDYTVDIKNLEKMFRETE